MITQIFEVDNTWTNITVEGEIKVQNIRSRGTMVVRVTDGTTPADEDGIEIRPNEVMPFAVDAGESVFARYLIDVEGKAVVA